MGRTGTTKIDWVRAGQTLLIEGGIDAVKLHRLTEQLQVSTGSFYHHFRNLDDYLSSLAEFYGTEQAQLLFDEARCRVGEDPVRLIQEATAMYGWGSMRLLNIAMRAWAHGDDRALAAIRRYDEVLMDQLDEIFLALGFDELAAKSRTLIMMGLSSLDLGQKGMKPTFHDRWLHIRELILDGAQSAR